MDSPPLMLDDDPLEDECWGPEENTGTIFIFAVLAPEAALGFGLFPSLMDACDSTLCLLRGGATFELLLEFRDTS
jgi:hypothetical protein